MWIKPDWPAPANIKAFTTTREGGVSQAPYGSLNLAAHVGDNPRHVAENREILRSTAQLPEPPRWLNQTHSTIAVATEQWEPGIEADAIFSTQANQLCTVMTADCLPVLLCNQAGDKVAAIHAGWRGLLNGIIENTVQALNAPGETILGWLGPAIGPKQFEVGREVYQAFVDYRDEAQHAFIQTDANHYLADIYQLARQRLNEVGVEQIFGGDLCTYSDAERFYSYRREENTGRMASVIWFSPK
jgi:YfiH family protein